ncbi:MAG: flagellar basal body P-ring formation chaperone FlgA [Bacillota bacterium]
MFPPAVRGLEIIIPREVKIASSRVLLGDIARIQGVENEEKESLEQIDLGQAPSPGYTREFTRELVRLLLKQEGYQGMSLSLEVPDVFTVSTSARVINRDTLAEFVREYIARNLPETIEDYEITFNQIPKGVTVPDTDYELKAVDNREINAGRFSFPVAVMIDGQQEERVYINLSLTVYGEVYVARYSLDRGQSPAKQDFELKKTGISDLRGSPVTDWDSDLVQNGVLRGSMKKGEVLTREDLKQPVVISWGDRVKARVVIGSVQVSVSVKARDRGRIGDFIEVENSETGDRFKARIVSEQLVTVVKDSNKGG